MDELERQLRSALTEMAGRVPPSHDAWAEHQRRLARQKSRRPVLMVAAAAAVVALIAIPVLLLNMRPAQLADVTGTSAVINGDKSSVCVAMNAPRAGRVVWLKYNVPSQMGSSLIVFVASHPTDNVLMRTSQGYYTSAAKVADGPDFGFFLGYTNNPTAYTARDKANVTLENG
jgi:hypothetical protein